MNNRDLTVILLTANRVPEGWASFHRESITEAIGEYPIITISKKPMDWGINILQTEPYGISNIYVQLLKGARVADTKYIAVVEDDCLYPKEHFDFRPPEDTFAYNMNRFNVFRWSRKPTFFWKNRMSNCTLVSPRQLAIDALEERFSKYTGELPPNFVGELGRRMIENNLGVTLRKSMWFETEVSVIKVDHELGIDKLAQTHRKGMGILRSYDIPHWGRAEDIVSKFV